MIVFVEIILDRTDPDEALIYERCERDGDLRLEATAEIGPIRDLDDLAAALDGAQVGEHSEYTIDMLPTFGGEDLDEAGVVSWDEERVLVHDGAGRFTLHSRG